MTLEETYKTYEKYITESISKYVDLRSLVYVYMAQNPGSTQTSIAQRLGVSQVMLSRMLSNPKQGIREEMIPGVMVLLRELDVDSFQSSWLHISRIALDQDRYERRKSLVPLVLEYINQSDEGPFELSRFELSNQIFLCSRCDKMYSWGFIEVNHSSDAYNMISILERTQSFSREQKNRVSYVCFEEPTFRSLIEDEPRLWTRFGNHYKSVLHVNMNEGKVQTEYLLQASLEVPSGV